MKNRGIIAVLSILALFLCLFAYLLASEKLTNPKEYERDIKKVETTSDSDDTDAIEKDLEETDVDSTDSEVIKIESELNSNY